VFPVSLSLSFVIDVYYGLCLYHPLYLWDEHFPSQRNARCIRITGLYEVKKKKKKKKKQKKNAWNKEEKDNLSSSPNIFFN